jgi:hypothetical protein
MNHPEPTADEFRAAYKASKLRWIGVSLQKALSVPSVKIALRCKAISQRKKQQGELCAHG